jgi:hypothetical protein
LATLGPYKKKPKEDYEYRLVGVTVHSGTAEFGHYYSYINTNRRDTNTLLTDPSKDQWLEFNDSLIKNYDVSNLPSDCFGGTETVTNASNTFAISSTMENSKNAYILVYDKVIKGKLSLKYKTGEEKMEIERLLN